MAARPAGLASRIADFACRFGWDDLSAPRRTKVRWFLADFVGSTLAGSTLPEAESGYVLAQPGPVKLPGDARGLTPESAAVAMGTVGALLQIHDGFGGGGNHPSSAIVSALWAARGERPLAALALPRRSATRSRTGSRRTRIPRRRSAAPRRPPPPGRSAPRRRSRGCAGYRRPKPRARSRSPRSRRPSRRCAASPSTARWCRCTAASRRGPRWRQCASPPPGSTRARGCWKAATIRDSSSCCAATRHGSSRSAGAAKRSTASSSSRCPACRHAQPAIEAILAILAGGPVPAESIREVVVHTYPVALMFGQPPRPEHELYDRLMSMPWAIASTLVHRGFGFDNVIAPARDPRIEALYPRIRNVVEPAFAARLSAHVLHAGRDRVAPTAPRGRANAAWSTACRPRTGRTRRAARPRRRSTRPACGGSSSISPAAACRAARRSRCSTRSSNGSGCHEQIRGRRDRRRREHLDAGVGRDAAGARRVLRRQDEGQPGNAERHLARARCSRGWTRPASSAPSWSRPRPAASAIPPAITCPTRSSRTRSRNTRIASTALAGLDPYEGMAGVRAFESAVKEYGFIGAHLYPHWFELAPDHAQVLSVLREVLRARRAGAAAGRPVDDLRPGLPAAQRRAGRSRSMRSPATFPELKLDRHPRRHSLDRRDDRDGVEAQERLHRLRRPQPEVLAASPSCTTSTRSARIR